MEPTEASLSLKPAKHAWYAVVFVVLLLALFANIVECLVAEPPVFHTNMDRLGYLFFVAGRLLYTIINGAPYIAASLALLFFFDGRFSKMLVVCLLSWWGFWQATILHRTVSQAAAKMQPQQIAEQRVQGQPRTMPDRKKAYRLHSSSSEHDISVKAAR
jgi:hypothetical protein